MLTESSLETDMWHRNSRFFSSSSSENPKRIVENTIDSLRDFAAKLRDLAGRVDHRHTITTPLRSIQVSVAEAALHSRDSSMEDFSTTLAGEMRELLVQEAKILEADLAVLANEYTHTIQPQMQRATTMCLETPCGGATWELNIATLLERANEQGGVRGDTTTSSNQKVALGDMHETPCGRLHLQSMSFLETTLLTKQEMMMVSRCRTLLALSMEFGAPLQHIRTHGSPEQNQRIRSEFQKGDNSTPWIRTDVEYEQLRKVKGDLKVR